MSSGGHTAAAACGGARHRGCARPACWNQGWQVLLPADGLGLSGRSVEAQNRQGRTKITFSKPQAQETPASWTGRLPLPGQRLTVRCGAGAKIAVGTSTNELICYDRSSGQIVPQVRAPLQPHSRADSLAPLNGPRARGDSADSGALVVTARPGHHSGPLCRRLGACDRPMLAVLRHSGR